MKVSMDWLKKIPIAHRGLHSKDKGIPENSILAFKEAISEKYPIELDVHLLTDNEIAVFHDYTLERMCGEKMFIQSLNSTQLKDYTLLNSNERIPLLDQVLQLVGGQVPILIEIKNHKNKNKIQRALIKSLTNYKGNVAIQSFDPFLLKHFIHASPSIPRGQLSSSFKDEKINFIVKFFTAAFVLKFYKQTSFHRL